jgi:hypothetical protein
MNETLPLLTTTIKHFVRGSRDIHNLFTADSNVPCFLLTLSDRNIIPPADPHVLPAREHLAELRTEWLL